MRRFTEEELAEIAAADAEDDKRETERHRAYYQAHKAERIEYANAYQAQKKCKHEKGVTP